MGWLQYNTILKQRGGAESPQWSISEYLNFFSEQTCGSIKIRKMWKAENKHFQFWLQTDLRIFTKRKKNKILTIFSKNTKLILPFLRSVQEKTIQTTHTSRSWTGIILSAQLSISTGTKKNSKLPLKPWNLLKYGQHSYLNSSGLSELSQQIANL